MADTTKLDFAGDADGRVLDSLMERMHACSREALAAARDGQDDRLRQLVQERDAIVVRLGPMLQSLRLVPAAGASRRGAHDRAVRALRALEEADVRLMAQLREKRDAAVLELRQLTERSANPNGYQLGRESAGNHIDLRR
jgi:hypothetical protein